MTVIPGRTEAEAKAKHADYRRYVDPEGALALFSGWTGVDFSKYDLGQTRVRYIETEAVRSALDNVTRADPDRVWTVRELAEHVAIGGAGPVLVGSPEQVADEIEAWFEQTDVDGFNLPFAVSPGDFEDIAELLVPELTRRGRYKSAYRAGDLARKIVRRWPRKVDGTASGRGVSAEGGKWTPVSSSFRRSEDRIQGRKEELDCFVASLARGMTDDEPQFTELFTITSINFAPGRLNAEDNTDFNWPGSVTLIDFQCPAIWRRR